MHQLATQLTIPQLELFKSSLPKKPYCSDDLGYGLVIRNLAHASQKRHIQPNHPNSKLWLVYDIDRPTSPEELTDDIGLPMPHIFTQNPQNQHAHAFYGLEVPVHLNQSSSKAAIRFAGAVDAAVSIKMGADASYSGLISKNPLHNHWNTRASNHDHYELGEMAEYVDLEPYRDRRKALPAVGLGRNCNTFESLRKWAYRAIRQGWPDWADWLQAVNAKALEINASQDGCPLHFSEVQHIAKSVATWVHRNFDPQAFSAYQAAQGAKGGIAKGRAYEDKRASAALMMAAGHKQSEIAAELEVSTKTVTRWKKGQ